MKLRLFGKKQKKSDRSLLIIDDLYVTIIINKSNWLQIIPKGRKRGDLVLKIVQNSALADGFYNGFLVLGLLSALCFGIWYRKKYSLSFRQAVALTVTVLALIMGWTVIHFLLETGFTGAGTKSVVRAVPYLMLIIWPVAALLKIKWKTACDFLAPSVCLYIGIVQFGCVFTGCCQGYPSRWGIYNHHYDGLAFPVQIAEGLLVLGLFLLLLRRNKKCCYSSDGKTMPVMLLLFGIMRFLCEFARNNEKLWLGCSAIAFHALFAAVVGTDFLVTIWEKDKQKMENTERYFRNPHKARRQKR